MIDTVLIEVSTSLPEGLFSWWHLGIIAVMVIIVWVAVWLLFDKEENTIGDALGLGIAFTMAALLVWVFLSFVAFGVDKVIPDDEATRVATEISEVTGVEVSAEEVRSMEDGDYVPGVNYDTLTDSDGGLVLKVEVRQ